MKAALVTTFGSPIPGREHLAIEYARQVDDYWGKVAALGICSEPEWYWASRGHNIWVTRGEMEDLMDQLLSPVGVWLMNKGKALVEGFGYDLYVCGREEGLKPFEDMLAQLRLAA